MIAKIQAGMSAKNSARTGLFYFLPGLHI